MRRILFPGLLGAAALFLARPPVVGAADAAALKTDFSGRWTLDEGLSEDPFEKMRDARGRGGGGSGGEGGSEAGGMRGGGFGRGGFGGHGGSGGRGRSFSFRRVYDPDFESPAEPSPAPSPAVPEPSSAH